MNILDPITVGGVVFKNRLMLPPLTTGYEAKDGSISAQSRAFYTRLAKGGVGYIVLGDVAPIPSFVKSPRLIASKVSMSLCESFVRLIRLNSSCQFFMASLWNRTLENPSMAYVENRKPVDRLICPQVSMESGCC